MSSSPHVAAHCTSELPIDSSDGPGLISCEYEGWDKQLWIDAA